MYQMSIVDCIRKTDERKICFLEYFQSNKELQKIDELIFIFIPFIEIYAFSTLVKLNFGDTYFTEKIV